MSKGQPTSSNEIRALLGLVERDQRQARISGLHLDGEFGYLYNVALQLATITLRLNGLRVGQTAHHRKTFRDVREWVPDDLKPVILHFDRARRKRNTLTYDQVGTISRADVEGLRDAIGAFEVWVRSEAEEYLAEHGEDAESGAQA